MAGGQREARGILPRVADKRLFDPRAVGMRRAWGRGGGGVWTETGFPRLPPHPVLVKVLLLTTCLELGTLEEKSVSTILKTDRTGHALVSSPRCLCQLDHSEESPIIEHTQD